MWITLDILSGCLDFGEVMDELIAEIEFELCMLLGDIVWIDPNHFVEFFRSVHSIHFLG